jgi:hypothetical protein
MAGCGLGSLVFKSQPGKIQIFAATINATGVQTFGITSGTSGCYENRRETAALFIEINKVALQKEIAQGTGETISGLNEIYGCQNQDAFSSTLQSNFKEIYSEESSVNENILKVLVQDNELRNCKVFS